MVGAVAVGDGWGVALAVGLALALAVGSSSLAEVLVGGGGCRARARERGGFRGGGRLRLALAVAALADGVCDAVDVALVVGDALGVADGVAVGLASGVVVVNARVPLYRAAPGGSSAGRWCLISCDLVRRLAWHRHGDLVVALPLDLGAGVTRAVHPVEQHPDGRLHLVARRRRAGRGDRLEHRLGAA